MLDQKGKCAVEVNISKTIFYVQPRSAKICEAQKLVGSCKFRFNRYKINVQNLVVLGITYACIQLTES